MSSLSDRDVIEGIRRMMLDHGHKQLRLESAPAAGSVGMWEGTFGGAAPYFEITLDGRTFLVAAVKLAR